MKETAQALRKLYTEILTKEKISIHLKNIDRLIIEKEYKLKELKELMQKETEDLEKLQKKSLYSVFHFILGNKEQQLEKERQEYLQAYLEHQSVEATIKELKKEKNTLLRSYSSKFSIEKSFDKLMIKIQDKIEEERPELAEFIIQYEKKIANHKNKITEIDQAIREGRKAVRVLQKNLIGLEKIQHWGTRNSKMSKTNIARAKDKIQRDTQRADGYIQKFEKELFDLTDHHEMDYSRQIDEIKDYIHQFYDSLITDWVVKERIENSANITHNTSDKIERIVSMLESDKAKTKEFIQLEEKDKRALIIKKIVK